MKNIDYLTISNEEEYLKHLKRVARNLTMPRVRSLNHELTAFFEGIDLESLLRKSHKVLELGCGCGYTLRDLRDRFGVKAYGIDLDLFNLKFSDLIASVIGISTGVRFRTGDIQNLPYNDGTFDFVFSYKAFEYVLDKLQGLKEAHRVMKIGAKAFIDLETVTKSAPPSVQPPIEEILEKYPNDGQLTVKMVPIPEAVVPDFGTHNSRRITINKSSKAPLIFPPLMQSYSRIVVPEAISIYKT